MRDLAAQVSADAMEMPIDRLVRRMNCADLSDEYRDKLAAIVTPYTAPRLSGVSISKRPSQMSDEELAALAGTTEEDLLRLGEGRDKWPRPLHKTASSRSSGPSRRSGPSSAVFRSVRKMPAGCFTKSST